MQRMDHQVTYSTASVVVGGSTVQNRTRPTENNSEKRNQEKKLPGRGTQQAESTAVDGQK